MEKILLPKFVCRGCGCAWDTVWEVATCCNGEGWDVVFPDEAQTNNACSGLAPTAAQNGTSEAGASR